MQLLWGGHQPSILHVPARCEHSPCVQHISRATGLPCHAWKLFVRTRKQTNVSCYLPAQFYQDRFEKDQIAECIFPQCQMYLSNVHNAKCICPHRQMYLSKLPNVFVQIAKYSVLLLTCMILSRRVCRGRQRQVHEVERSRRTQPSGQFCCSQ